MTKGVLTSVIPATLGQCADKLYQLREQRLKLQRSVDELARQEEELRGHVIKALNEQHATAVCGKRARAGLTLMKVGTVQDWDVVQRHVLATGDFALLQRRLNDAYLRERWEAGDMVPGVEPFTVVKVSLTKV